MTDKERREIMDVATLKMISNHITDFGKIELGTPQSHELIRAWTRLNTLLTT